MKTILLALRQFDLFVIFLDAMGMVKLNTFHWHITDSQSFPLVLKSHPELSRLGAYSSDKVYTAEDISEVTKNDP